MNSAADNLLIELQLKASGRKKLDYAAICTAFGLLFPSVTGLEQRRRLHELLHLLSDCGAMSLPAGREHYDCSTLPHMPRWVLLKVVQQKNAGPHFNAASFPWVPALRFAAQLRSSHHLDVLRRVHEFMIGGGATRCMVPIKERSVELFGDEKRLDDLRFGALFRSGKLSLDLLRCFQVTPPLVWERGPSASPQPVLIIENHCSWHSFVRWNKEHGAWAAICYGSGDCFETSAPSLAGVVEGSSWNGQFHYFGDLDPKGLLIPVRASKALKLVGLPPVEPQRSCYGMLLARVPAARLPVAQKLGFPQEAKAWFDTTMIDEVVAWFEKGVRIPQELLGYEALAEKFSGLSVKVANEALNGHPESISGAGG